MINQRQGKTNKWLVGAYSLISHFFVPVKTKQETKGDKL